MRTHSYHPVLAWCAIVLVVAGCAGSTAPRGRVPTVAEAATDVFGAWIDARTVHGSKPPKVAGELIAVAQDSVFVLTTEGLVVLPQSAIAQAEISCYESDAGDATGWAILGGVSTISHGVGLVLTLPMWIITGVATSHSVAGDARLHVPARSWAVAADYARFPGGLPAGLDRDRLKLKPVGRIQKTGTMRE